MDDDPAGGDRPNEPVAERPHMPGYGIDEGAEGMLPWRWAVERLTDSHEYWLATAWPDGQPHVMPVWAVWLDGALWFSTSVHSRKGANLRSDPRCTLTTDDPLEPVVFEGVAEIVTAVGPIATFLAASNQKYGVSYEIDFLEPSVNHTVRVPPTTVFGLTEADFIATPTRWSFPR